MSITFGHDPRIRDAFPALSAGALLLDDVETLQRPDRAIANLEATAAGRLEEHSESEFPEIQAWRRAFAQMGLKPTQYRCAAEALLRRVRIQGALPQLHPLVDLCNAASVATAVPVAVFDRHAITTDLVVRPASGGGLPDLRRRTRESRRRRDHLRRHSRVCPRPTLDQPTKRTLRDPA